MKVIKSRMKILKEVERIAGNSNKILVIHYSCESFYNIKDGRTPRITSIAVNFYDEGETRSFSIHKVAEKKGVSYEKIEENYDELERTMLSDFFEFVERYKDYYWIHWNMRDINYGFEAINHRFEVLGGKPVIISNSNKLDLANVLTKIYSKSYIEHPRFEKLMKLNEVTDKGYLKGMEEAEAFENKEFVKLHQSTLRKSQVLSEFMYLIIHKKLKHKAKLADIYDLSLTSLFYFVTSEPLGFFIWSGVVLMLGLVASKYI